MGPSDFIDDFQSDAVGKIPKRSYPANDVFERLGVSTHSPYAWKRAFAKAENMMAEIIGEYD